MVEIPKRNSLVYQTTLILRAEIKKNTWGKWLPAERELCKVLQVGRNTLRSAMDQLKNEGLLISNRGQGTQVTSKRVGKIKRTHKRTIGLISPEPLDRLRPYITLLIGELRFMLRDTKINLKLHTGKVFYQKNPEKALDKLIRSDSADCWILALSSKNIQKWFLKNSIPCIVTGTPHPGVNLPSVDLDFRAICRHATGKLISLGHKRISIILEKAGTGGMVDAEAGFSEAIIHSSNTELKPVVLYSELEPNGIRRIIERDLKKINPPTAYIVTNTLFHLTIISLLHQYNREVPRDISIITTHFDSFLSFLIPHPTTYDTHPYNQAHGLLKMALRVINGEPIHNSHLRIIPEFVPGATIGAAKE